MLRDAPTDRSVWACWFGVRLVRRAASSECEEGPVNVDDVVAEQVDAARRKAVADKETRAQLRENRAFGVVARHAAARAREARQQPVKARVEERRAHCPGCRRERLVRPVGSGLVRGRGVELLECMHGPCGLVWVTRRPAPVTGAA